jgi:hypothetical protein
MTARVSSKELFKLCCLFNGARGYVESNMGETLIELMRSMEHGGHTGEDFVLMQQQDALSVQAMVARQIGFYTSVKTRESVIAAVEAVLMEAGMYDPERGTPFDIQEIVECLVFERDEKGKAEAARGHDDAVFAVGLRELARQKIIRDGEVALVSRVKPKVAEDPLVAFWRQQYKQERDKTMNTGGKSVLSGF